LSASRQATVAREEPLLAYLIDTLGLKRKTSKNLLKFGAIAVNGATVRKFDHPLVVGDKIAVSAARTAVAAGRLAHARVRVLHEDAALIVVEKPAGLLTVATESNESDTLFLRLSAFLRERSAVAETERALVVHRLDRETSGLVVFAKRVEIQEQLQAAWPSVEKIYLAIVIGKPEPAEGTITSYLTETTALQVFSNDHPTDGGRIATTHYRTLQSRGEFSLLEVRLETGRKHQIRVHLAGLGCLVVGDRRYGATLNPSKRLGLHATQLALNHPLSGERLTFNSPLPAVLQRLFPARNDLAARG
jgi:23S rRNA pseudouridine1911/1915/1917 synthase